MFEKEQVLESARRALEDEEFLAVFYEVFLEAVCTEGERPERIAREILQSFVNQEDCNEMLISCCGYSVKSLLHLTKERSAK